MTPRIASALLAAALLAGCSNWLGESEDPPLPGERISVLAQQRMLEPDTVEAPIQLPKPAPNTVWPQAGGHPPHAMHHLELADKPTRAWRTDIGDGSGSRVRLITNPVVADGRVFAMDVDAQVTTVEAASGARVWQIDLRPESERDGNIGGGIAHDGGRLFVSNGFGQIVAVDAASGKEIWRQTLSAPVRGAPTVRGGRVLAITVDNQTHALAAEDGRPLWSHAGITEVASLLGGSSPAVDGGIVVSAYSSGELVALRIENGTELWADSLATLRRTDAVATLTDIRGLPVIDRDRVYAVGNGDMMVAIDLRSGRRLWDRAIGSIQTPWVAGDFVYVLTNNAEVAALDGRNGRVHWVSPLQRWADEKDREGVIVWSGPILAGDRLIVSGSHGWALSLSPYTGEVLGREKMPDAVIIAPIVADRTLFFLTDNADLIAYR